MATITVGVRNGGLGMVGTGVIDIIAVAIDTGNAREDWSGRGRRLLGTEGRRRQGKAEPGKRSLLLSSLDCIRKKIQINVFVSSGALASICLGWPSSRKAWGCRRCRHWERLGVGVTAISVALEGRHCHQAVECVSGSARECENLRCNRESPWMLRCNQG